MSHDGSDEEVFDHPGVEEAVNVKYESIALAEIQEGQELLINYAYHLGLIPIYMDKRTKLVHHVNSKWKLFCCACVQTILFAHRAGVTWFYFKDFFNDNISLSRPYDLMHTEYVAIFAYTWLLHLFSIWKSHELVALINNVSVYYARFEEMFGNTCGPKNRALYGKILKIVFWSCTIMQFTSAGTYLDACEMHLDSRVFHICDCQVQQNSTVKGEGEICKWIHVTGPKILLFCALHAFAIVDQLACIYVYLALIVPAILLTVDMQSALLYTDSGSYFHSQTHWVKHYRSIQILMAHFNDCFQNVFLPVDLSCVMAAVICFSYIVIRVDLAPGVRAGQVFVALVFTGVLTGALGNMAKVRTISENALMEFKISSRARANKIERMELDSLNKIQIGVGSAQYLDESSKLAAYMYIVDRTGDLLLTF